MDLNPSELILSSQQKKLLNAAQEISEGDPSQIGFICRSMVSASMPHSKVHGFQYKRKCNNFTLNITGNEDAGGIPYGTYPRLILSWISSEVVKKKEREIVLGQSLSGFMNDLGLSVTGGRWGTILRFKDQIKKLFSSNMTFTYEDAKEGKWVHANLNITEKAQIYWDPQNPKQIDLFKSKILLGSAFFEEILKAPIPVDMRAINALKDSSLALDIYFWATYRMSYLNAPIKLSFLILQLQFGAGYSDTPHGRYEFKRKFLVQFKKVMSIYPQMKVSVQDDGLLLYPSPTHVKQYRKIVIN